MADLIEQLATVMGMKPHREVQEAVPVDGGHAVRTHDGRWTLVRDDGTTEPFELASGGVVNAEEATAAMLRGVHGEPEEAAVAEPAKPGPKRRARS